MRSLINWHDDAENVAPEERATVADWRLYVGEQNVTLHRAGNRSFEIVTLPLVHLAAGLAHDWWTLFGARDAEVNLANYRMGFAVPDVRMSFDGAIFEIGARQKTYSNPPILFWGGPAEVLSRQDAEQELSSFISTVLDRLDARDVAVTAARLRWTRVERSREDPLEAAFCEAAGALRLNPYAIGDRSAGLIEQASELFSGEPLLEFLSGVGAARGREAVDWVEGVERRPAYDSRLPHLRGLAESVAATQPQRQGERSYELGYRRAQAARRELQLGQNSRLRNMRELSGKLGSHTFQLAPRINGLRALRSDRRGTEHVHLRTQGDQDEARSGHLFALARAVGDAVCFPEPGRYSINDLRDADRQAAGRAFAAELLAPIDEVVSMRADGRDALTIASELGVSSQVIEHQLENEERIRAACAA